MIKNIFTYKNILFALTGLLIFFAVTFYYLNRINIIYPLSIKINHISTNGESLKLIGVSPFDRKFELKKSDNSTWNTNDYYLKSILISSDTLSQEPLICEVSYWKNKELLLDTFHIKLTKSQQIIPIDIQTSIAEKGMFLISKTFLPIITSLNLILVFIILVLAIIMFASKKINTLFGVKLFYTTLSFCLIAILVFLSFYTFPTPEDYQISLYAKEYGLKLPYVFYHFIDGRYFTNLLYVILNPLYYGDERFYFLSSLLVIVLLYYSFYYLIQKTFNLPNIFTHLFLTNILFLLWANYLYSTSYAFFWMASAYVYSIIIVFTNFLIAVTIDYFNNKININIFLIKASLFLIILIGINELSIGIAFWYGLLFFIWAYRKNRHSLKHIYIISSIVLPIITVLLSSGSELRSFTPELPTILDKISFSYLSGIMLISAKASSTFVFSIFTNYALIFNLFIVICILNFFKIMPSFKITIFQRMCIFGSFLGLTFIVSTIFFFSIEDAQALPERINNVLLYCFIITSIISTLSIKTDILFLQNLNPALKKTFLFALFSLIISLLFVRETTVNIFYHEISEGRIEKFNRNNIEILQVLNYKNNSFYYQKIPNYTKESSLLYSQNFYSNNVLLNDVSNYFKHYNLVVEPNINKLIIDSNLSFEKSLNETQYFNNDFNSFESFFNQSKLVDLLKLAKTIKSDNGEKIKNCEKYINTQNLINELYLVDSTLISIIPDSVKTEKSINNYIFTNNMLSIFWRNFPKNIIKVSFQNNNVYLFFANPTRDIITPLKLEYSLEGKINRVYLYNFYTKLFEAKQKYFTKSVTDSLKVIDFKVSLNQYDTTLITQSLFINQCKENITKICITHVLTDSKKSFKIPINSTFYYKKQNSNLQEMAFMSQRKLDVNNVLDKYLIYTLATKNTYSKISEINSFK